MTFTGFKPQFYGKLFVKSIGAGIILSLAGAASILASATIENPSLALLVKSLVFSIGLLLILIFGFSLFTGSVASLLTIDDMNILSYSLGLITAWIGNLIGSLYGVLMVLIGTKMKFQETFATICETKCSLNPIAAISLGIGCNFLIAAAVLNTSRKDCNELYKMIFAAGCVFLFVICGFEHSVANMFYLSYGLICGATNTIPQILFHNLLPVTLGNLIGGWVLMLFWYEIEHSKRA